MTVLQSMYQPSTGQWENTLWWQQANRLESIIDYSLRAHTTTYIGDIVDAIPIFV
jgi:hypothetical protein